MSEHSFYITTPIFYPNALPHIGNAYNAIVVDTLARYHRLLGHETYFLTGTDENTEKVVKAAEKLGKKPDVYTDEIVGAFQSLYATLNISYNQFIRTSDRERHWPGVIEMWKRLEKAGDIYKGEYEGLYCVGCESFITEKELVDGKCPDHGTVPEKLKEKNYFFRLSKYRDSVKKVIQTGELEILPESRKNEVLSLFESGLDDISFSRPKKAIPWGIPVPGDHDQVIYVWCDALVNYISALGFGRTDGGLEKFWPANYHVIGKDILRFHAAIWPAMLLSAGIKLPQGILVHGFIISGGKKMSKTIGNVIDPIDLVNNYGADALRYYLLREKTVFEDHDMTEEKFKDAYNANLANGLGNLVSRILKMIEQYEIDVSDIVFESEEEILHSEEIKEYHEAFERLEINRAADFVWSLIAFMDSYIQDEKPFKTIENDREKAERDILFLVLRLFEVAVLLEPFMPDTSEAIKEGIRKGKAPENLFPRK